MASFEFIQSGEVDLIFLDIQMPLLTGIDFVKNTTLQPKVIFTTAHRDYAIEGYELDIVDYLLKPISFTRFFKAVNKYRQSLSVTDTTQDTIPLQQENDHMYVNVNKKFLKIHFKDISYVDSLKDYIRIHTSEEVIITKDKISAFIEKLPADFLRVHRSFIVNKNKITAFTARDIELGAVEIPIGDQYKSVVKALKA